MTAWLTVIGSVLTLIVGPLIAFFIKRYWDKKAADAATLKRQADEEALALKNSQTQSDKTGTINASIDEQRKARENWEKSQ